MSIELSQGSRIAFGSAFGATKNMTAVTNAAEGVATLEAAHGVTVNDIIHVITSGWQRLQGAVVRASVVATNDVTLEDFNTASTSQFPTGEGAGTVREVTTWTTITQVKSVQADSPGVDFVDITNLSDQVRRQIPGLENAPTLNFTLQFDSSLSWWPTLLPFSDGNIETPIRILTPSNKPIYSLAYLKMSRFPQINTGQEITHVLTAVLSSPIPSAYGS